MVLLRRRTPHAALITRHSEAELVESGLVKRNDDGALVINPLLAEPDLPLVALRGEKTGRIFNLMTGRGCIRGDDWPLFAILSDTHTAKTLKSTSETLLLADDLNDVILLRALGQPAAPIVGLDKLGQQHLEQFCKTFDVSLHRSRRESDDLPLANRGCSESAAKNQTATSSAGKLGSAKKGGVSKFQPTLTITGWSPVQLSLAEPESVHRAIAQLKGLSRFRGLYISEIAQWMPTPEQLAAIKFAINCKEPTWITGSVLDCLYDSTFYLESFGDRPAPVPPPDLSSALERLHMQQHHEPDAAALERQRKAIVEYDQIIAHDFIGRLLRDAQTTPNEIKRIMKVQLAQLYELGYAKFSEMRPCARAGRGSGGRLVGSSANCGKDTPTSEYLKVTDRILMLANRLLK